MFYIAYMFYTIHLPKISYSNSCDKFNLQPMLYVNLSCAQCYISDQFKMCVVPMSNAIIKMKNPGRLANDVLLLSARYLVSLRVLSSTTARLLSFGSFFRLGPEHSSSTLLFSKNKKELTQSQ